MSIQIVDMSKTTKKSKSNEVKAQCIALKADRNQCNRTVDSGSTVCWQHLKSGSAHGTIHEPAPVKAKSNRGRPKKNKDGVVSKTVTSDNLSIVIPNFTESESIIPTPPNSFLAVDNLKDINFIITDKNRVLDNTKEVGVGPFELEINIGAEPHISLTKTINFEDGKYTTNSIFQKILDFLKTKPSDSDYDQLISKAENAENDDVVYDHYNDLYENDEDATYMDLQLNMLKISSIVCRDSRYVCIVECHDEE